MPLLPVLRYKPSGLVKRQVWERTWDLQRREDAGEDVGPIPVPPKYASADFLNSDLWRLRGKLDVPKERFVCYPHASRDGDPSLVVGWAGWDHLRQAQALTAYYERMKSREGWPPDRLVPLLAGLDQLVPWLIQWHNELDPEYDLRMGDYYRDFVRRRGPGAGVHPGAGPRLGAAPGSTGSRATETTLSGVVVGEPPPGGLRWRFSTPGHRAMTPGMASSWSPAGSWRGSRRRYLSPDLPPEVLGGALATYLHLRPGELLLAILDGTGGEKPDRGCALTTRRLYWAGPPQSPLSGPPAPEDPESGSCPPRSLSVAYTELGQPVYRSRYLTRGIELGGDRNAPVPGLGGPRRRPWPRS